MADGIVIGITFGSFDLLHAGHVSMLEQCKNHCKWLIVGLQTDPTINRPMEKNKPVQTTFERFMQLNALRCVDEIIPYDTEDDLKVTDGFNPQTNCNDSTQEYSSGLPPWPYAFARLSNASREVGCSGEVVTPAKCSTAGAESKYVSLQKS